jgi:hypothetical protein
MKRLIAAVSFTALAVPAFAAGLPYDQSEVDRALPNVPENVVRADGTPAFGAPYDQSLVDRALPNIEPRPARFAAAAGSTRSDAGSDNETGDESPWANDYHFIAPAQ